MDKKHSFQRTNNEAAMTVYPNANNTNIGFPIEIITIAKKGDIK
tara:strand:- start:850 stop:981 length:132 start_codon:yes stop_codon:yes gene_type:complete